MTDDEGLSAGEAADWCGSGVTTREVTRLRRLPYYPQRVGGRQGPGQINIIGLTAR